MRKKTDKNANSKKISIKKPLLITVGLVFLVLAGLTLFAGSGYYYYKNVLINPERTLSDMLDKSMQATSVSRISEEKAGINSSTENILLAFQPKTASKSITTLEEISQAGKTTAVIEKIGEPDADYVRYNKVEVTGNSSPRNFDSVLGIWGKREGNPASGESATFLNNALFSAVPFGNLNQDQRREIKDEIKRVNLYQYREVKRESKNGRPTLVYTMEISPQSLVQVLAKYIKVSGVQTSAVLDPAAYEGAENIRLRLGVDVLSRHIESMQFMSSDRVEYYRGYNAKAPIEAPTDTVSVDELQSKLQAVEPSQ